jgi:hypothetical protein
MAAGSIPGASIKVGCEQIPAHFFIGVNLWALGVDQLHGTPPLKPWYDG